MSSWTLIENATVIDGTGAAPQERTSVLLKDNRIVAVGAGATRGGVTDGGVPSVIDASGKTVMPGLIDAHCHVTYGDTRTQEEQDLYTSVESRTLRAAWNIKKMLRAGVTSCSEPGGSYYIGVALREAIKTGHLLGPRLTTAGRYLTTSNGIADFYPDSVGVPDGSLGMLTNSAAEMVTAVRKHAKNGVDLIKLADSQRGDYQAFSYDEMAAVVERAHQLKKKVTIHARGAGEVDAAVRAGVDWIMHGNFMSDEGIERLAESRIPLCPTLLLHANWSEYGNLVGVPAAIRDGVKRGLERTAVTLHKAHKAGVRFMAGSDSGFSVTPYGEWHARELRLLMDYGGLSALEAIRAATVDAAITVNLEGEVGAVAPGQLADLIVVDGDPSKDIGVLLDKRRIHTVIRDGALVPFDEVEVESWPHDRAQVFATGELTYDLVHGEPNLDANGMATGRLSEEEARSTLSDLRVRQAAAMEAGMAAVLGEPPC
jgi:imidazolonepropionase-like amidohydrolase